MSTHCILVINCGSSSLKFALVQEGRTEFLISGLAERLGTQEALLNWKEEDQKHSKPIPGAGHKEAMKQLLPLVLDQKDITLDGIGHRVVHGGEHFSAAHLLTPDAVAKIQEVSPLAPLHNPPALQGIEAAQAVFPNFPQAAIFDTAFHQTLPEHAFRYAVPDYLYREHSVRRYGFHGTSHRYVSRRAAAMVGLPPDDSCWISAHLGNGCSTCAILNGKSVDTSMGLTPLEGLVMGTRSGDVDPNLHGHLQRTMGWDIAKIDTVLNKESGLLGLSAGLSNDMRTLEEAYEKGNQAAVIAIEVFCYRLAKSIASMTSALPRLDGLVFTGGIGENSDFVRAKTVNWLKLLHYKIDAQANTRCVRGEAGFIGAKGSPHILVVPTNEEYQIAQDVLALLDKTGN